MITLQAPDIDYPVHGSLEVANSANGQTSYIPVHYQPDGTANEHTGTRRGIQFEWADALVLLLICALLYMACTGAFNRTHHMKIK